MNAAVTRAINLIGAGPLTDALASLAQDAAAALAQAIVGSDSPVASYTKQEADSANAASPEIPILAASPRAFTIASVTLTPNADIAATGNTDNKTITIWRRDAAGANRTAMAIFSTATGTATGFVAHPMTLGNDLTVAAGQELTADVEFGGAGVILPPFRVEVRAAA